MTPWSWCLLIPITAVAAALFVAFRAGQARHAASGEDSRFAHLSGFVTSCSLVFLRQHLLISAIGCSIVFFLLTVFCDGFGYASPVLPWAFLSGCVAGGLHLQWTLHLANCTRQRAVPLASQSQVEAYRAIFEGSAAIGLLASAVPLAHLVAWVAGLVWLAPLFDVRFEPLELATTLLCFGLGATCQALFVRVGGGVFAKAADVGADLSGKVEAELPEDDPRNPASIADTVGDNVGDVVANAADLLDSLGGALVAVCLLGAAAVHWQSLAEGAAPNHGAADRLWAAFFMPLVIAGVGLAFSILGYYWADRSLEVEEHRLVRGVSRGVGLAVILSLLATMLVVFLMLGVKRLWGLSGAFAIGQIVAWTNGWWLSHSTQRQQPAVRALSDQAQYGPSTLIIDGIAEGMLRTWVPNGTLALGACLAYALPTRFALSDLEQLPVGLYGIALAALGMLSTMGIALASSTSRSLADGAQGYAKLSRHELATRQRLERVAHLAEASAASAKGLATGSAVLTALALTAAYLEQVHQFHLRSNPVLSAEEWAPAPKEKMADTAARANVSEPTVTSASRRSTEPPTLADTLAAWKIHPFHPRFLAGMWAGAMIVFSFASLTVKSVAMTASNLLLEVRRQFREIAGLLDGQAMPDYAACVRICVRAAQRQMVLPATVALLSPVAVGMLFGPVGVVGMLISSVASGFALAMMMALTGGLWQSVRRYVEAGAHGGVGSTAHKAAVISDAIGDPFKDVAGPAIHVLIKLLAVMSLVSAGFAVDFSL